MLAEDNITRRDGDDPIEVIVARLAQDMADLQARLGDFDPESFKGDVRSDFETFRENTQGTVQSLEVHLTAAVAKINGFEKLLKDAADLLKKIEALDLQKLDPEKIKQAVLDALADWRGTTDGRLNALELLVRDLEAKVNAISPDAIRDAVLNAIKDWQNTVEQDLAQIKAALDKVNEDLKDLTKKLADTISDLNKLADKVAPYETLLNQHAVDIKDLLARVKKLEEEDFDPQLIAAEVERLIKDWKILVESRLDALERLQNDVQALKDRLDALPHIFSETEIKTLITNEIEPKLSDLNNTLLLKINQLQTQLTTDLSSLNARVLLLEDKLKDLEPGKIVILVIKELESWQKQVEQRIVTLEQQRVLDRSDIDKLLQGLSDLIAKVNSLIILTRQDVLDIFNTNIQPWIAKIEALTLSLNTLDGTVKAHDLSIGTINTAITAIQTLFNGPLPANWEAQVKDIIATLIAALQADVAQLKTDKVALENAIAALENTLADLDAALKALESEVGALTAQVALLLTKEQIEALVASEIGALKALLESAILALKIRIENLEAVDAAIKTDIDKINADITAIIEKNSAQDIAIQELKDGLTALQHKVDNLPPIPKAEDIVKEVETIIVQWKTEIEVQIDDLVKCCNEGKEKIQTIENEIADIKKQIKNSEVSAIGLRLARRCLTGWGIVNGLDILSDDTCSIHLSKGSGITPRGILAHACESLYFTHYRKFVTAANDPVFKNYDVWELLVWETLGIEPGEAVPDNIEPLTPQTGKESETPFIADKAILLLPGDDSNHYLLLKIEDLIALQGKTAAVQKLMGDEGFDPDMQFSESFSPLDAIPTEDDLYKAFNPVMLLPEIPLFRFGFRPPDECDPEELDDPNFPPICKLDDMYETWLPIIKDAFSRVDKWTKVVMDQYHELLFPQLDVAVFEEKRALLFEKWGAFLSHNQNALPEKRRKYYVQYFYDWARDLLAGYHELRSELQILMAEFCLCRPDLLLEQRPYLMLGPAVRPNHDGLSAPLRDAFHQPPIYNGNAIRLETCRLYYRRQFEMIEGFYLPDYQDDAGMPCWCKHDDAAWKPDFSRLRITPGKGYIHALSRQSLPFYYPLAPNMESLHFYWEYRRAKMRQTDYHLSYHASDADDSYSNRPEVVRPLFYSLDAHDFYRVEGATGKWEIALNEKIKGTPGEILQYMVKRYNLDFEVVEVDLSCNQCRFLSQKYPLPNVTPQEFFHSFRQDLMGAEHLAGVPKGGTFIIVTERLPIEGMIFDGKTPYTVVADFALPYRCCPEKPAECRIELDVDVAKDCTNGQRVVRPSIKFANPTSNNLSLFVDGVEKAAIDISNKKQNVKFALDAISFPADGKQHKIKVLDKENPCCNAEWEELIAVCCTINVTAVVAQGNCVAGKRNVKLTIQKAGTGSSSGFNIEVDGKPYPFGTPDSYAYGSGAKTELTIELTGNADAQNIEIIDALNSDCRGRVSVTVPKCPCAMTVQVKRLNRTNNGVMMELVVNTENPESSEFSFSYTGVNVDIQRVFAYNKSGPTSTFQIEVPISELEHRIIVRDMKNTACRAETTFIPIEFIVNRPSTPRKPSKPKK